VVVLCAQVAEVVVEAVKLLVPQLPLLLALAWVLDLALMQATLAPLVVVELLFPWVVQCVWAVVGHTQDLVVREAARRIVTEIGIGSEAVSAAGVSGAAAADVAAAGAGGAAEVGAIARAAVAAGGSAAKAEVESNHDPSGPRPISALGVWSRANWSGAEAYIFKINL